MSIFRNYAQISDTPMRRDMLNILDSAVAAVDTDRALRQKLSIAGSELKIDHQNYNLSNYENVYVIAIGKAALDASITLENIMSDYITAGLVLDIRTGPLQKLTSVAGTHPFPSLPNMQATGQIMAILKHATGKDLIIGIITGGGSALLHWPNGQAQDDVALITKTMMEKGADIYEMNTVRKHLSAIQGGQFAQIAHPATVVGLIFSDVPGNDISMVASGPTYLDQTTIHDAEKVLAKYDVLLACDLQECSLTETPKDTKFFANVQNVLVVSNQIAAQAMVDTAQRLGYEPILRSTALSGEARAVGKMLATLPRPGQAIIAAGETTVTVTHPGIGGRNLEVALGAFEHVNANHLVASLTTDGHDNTDLAGAFADYPSRLKAIANQMDAQAALTTNRSYVFFKELGTCFDTGPTGVNVSDVMLALNRK